MPEENTWYPILGSIFSELLTPVGIHVDDHCPLTALIEEHAFEFLLLRCDGLNWTSEQYGMNTPPALSDLLQKGKTWQDSFL